MSAVLLRCLALVALTVAAGAGSTNAAPQPEPAQPSGIYVVRPDPRACPSPVCGGYWVSLANRERTRCSDGLLRPRCYVASAEDAVTHQVTPVPGDSLARATLGSETSPGWGQLGVLFVERTWAPVGRSPASGDFFRLGDTGVRCVRAPCFSFRLGRLNTSSRTTLVSSLDLGPAHTDPVALRRAMRALASSDGLLVAGRISRTADGGRLLAATQVYLTGWRPRA